MPFLRNITSGLRSLFRKEQVDRELDEELRAYQDMAAEEKMKDGMTRKEALRALRLERGSLEVSKEIVRSGGWESLVDTCWQDLRYAQRRLRMAPTFTIATVLTLALGIGATTSIFTLVHAVLLKSLPVANPGELYRLGKESRCCYQGAYSQKKSSPWFPTTCTNTFETLPKVFRNWRRSRHWRWSLVSDALARQKLRKAIQASSSLAIISPCSA
jgi:hypothetical protein